MDITKIRQLERPITARHDKIFLNIFFPLFLGTYVHNKLIVNIQMKMFLDFFSFLNIFLNI